MPRRKDRSGKRFLYLTTTGRVTGKPREIEIWYAESDGRFYVLVERGRQAQWVKNIERDPRVRMRVGGKGHAATARVLDPQRDAEAYGLAQRLMQEKYEWGDGLPVEITPLR